MTSAVPFATWFAYDGDGSTVEFSFPIRFLANSEVRVRSISAAGVETVLSLGSHYSLTGAGTDNGGTVTMVTAPASGVTLILERNTAPTQGIDLEDLVKSPADSAELQLDRFAMTVQDRDRDIGRSIKRQLIDPATGSLELPIAEAGKVLGFGVNGTIIAVDNDVVAAEASALAAQQALEEVQELVAGIVIQEPLKAPRILGNKTGRYTDILNLTTDGEYDVGAGDGSQTMRMVHTRFHHQVPVNQGIGVTDLQVGWGNWWMSLEQPASVYELDGTATITIRASIYSAYLGGWLALKFNGSLDGTLSVGGNLLSDPLGIELPAETDFWTMTRATIPDSDGYSSVPHGRICNLNFGEGALQASTTSADYTTSPGTGNTVSNMPGSPSYAVPQNNDYGFGPSLIVGRTSVVEASVVLLGDSIGDGYNDTGDSDGLQGHLARALGDDLPWTKFTRPGHSYLFLKPAQNHFRMFGAISGLVTHAFIQLGTNDLYANAQTYLQTRASAEVVFAALAARGVRVVACTVPPVTTSTDSWATTGNQTISNSPSGANTARISFNEWLRSLPDNVVGVVDVADACETARNSGIWKAGYTDDGVHMNATSAAAAAAAVDLDVFDLAA